MNPPTNVPTNPPTRAPRRNTEAEEEAFWNLAERLARFDSGLSPVGVDAWLTALACGPVQPDPQAWLPLCFDGAFERACADPEDHAQALAVLQSRLAVIRDELDAEALLDHPDQLRLNPLMDHWTDEDRAAMSAEAPEEAAEIAALQDGADWAESFVAGVDELLPLWQLSTDFDSDPELSGLLELVATLSWTDDDPDLQVVLHETYGDKVPDREQRVADALFAVQDLRVALLDHAPRPQTRRVAPMPGRNDPCHCGSGKKFKKCHGQSA